MHTVPRFVRTALTAAAAALLCTASAVAQNWVGTWATSPVPAANKNGAVLAADTTYRQIVHVSLGGNALRVVFTNEFGTEPLQIGAASVSLVAGNTAATPFAPTGTATAVTFGGQPGVSIPPGALIVSDPVALKLPAFADLSINTFFPAQNIKTITTHGFADQTSTQAAGNQLAAANQPAAGAADSTPADWKPITSWFFLKDVEVSAAADAGSIVFFGDSITDGALSSRNTNSRWPDVLARRLAANKKTAQLGVLNQGIGGNRLLHDNTGPSALARYDRDVLAQPGVRYVVLLEGINDIGHAADPVKPYDIITADDLKFALTQMIDRAHARGIKVIGATLTPYTGAKYMSPAGEAMRQAENDFIRHSGRFDGVIDFEKMTQDPANPAMFNPAFDSGDHLHPKDPGYKAMGEGIDLKLFEK